MHLSSLLSTLGQDFSGDAAKRYVAEIARHHRVQASPGYRAAAEWLAVTLQANGLDAAIERFPATESDHFWSLLSFQEWECRSATLDWQRADGLDRLCDERATAVSIIQRSIAVDGEFEVVDVGDGRPDDYANLAVAGKLVLSRAPVRETYLAAVVERQAAGILFDHIDATVPGRNRVDLADFRQYASFWWQPGMARAWGFVLTPRQGDTLRTALRAGEQVRLRAHIDAHFYDGSFEAVVATIPGTGSEEVLGIAHLCHPQGFANDNASGAACLLEVATTLQRLIAGGALPPPRRTLTFLWVPEMTGTYAWLAAHEDRIPGIVAGLNLDMVGERQETTGSVLVLERPPEAMASFAPDLLERLRDELIREQKSMGGAVDYALFRYTTTPFSGGSDHMITSDPTVGIPTPMLIQWPDRFYHTTADTIDHVDPRSLQRAGMLAGSYLYWLAQAGDDQARWLGWDMLSRYESRLSREVQDRTTPLLDSGSPGRAVGWERLVGLAGFRRERMSAALATLGRLAAVAADLPVWQQEADAITKQVLARSEHQIGHLDALPDASLRAAPDDHLVPVRLYRGPIMDLASPLPPISLAGADVTTWRQLYRDVPGWMSVRVYAEYWADGRRTLAEIARLVELETGRALAPAIAAYFRLLEKAGVVEFTPDPTH